MNKFDLNALLKTAKIPESSQEYWDDISRTVLTQLRRPAMVAPHQRTPWFPRLAWSLATAVCVLMAFAIGHWRGQTEAKTSTDILANAKVVGETLALFPNQVRAIVEDAHGVNLVLSDQGDVPVSTPIYLRICDGKQCVSVVTFSGQEVQVAGQKMTVLADARGGIILTGDQFVWSNTERNYAGNHLKIEAKNL